MEAVLIAPGTYDLAHLGHENIVRRAAKLFGNIIVICSNNEEKNARWFSPKESKEAWYCYDPGDNITIMTFDEFMATNTPSQNIVMVRGIRGPEDLVYEQKIRAYNQRVYGIEAYIYLTAKEEYVGISSTKARNMAMEGNLEELEKIVHPKIAMKLIERAREIKRRK